MEEKSININFTAKLKISKLVNLVSYQQSVFWNVLSGCGHHVFFIVIYDVGIIMNLDLVRVSLSNVH